MPGYFVDHGASVLKIGRVGQKGACVSRKILEISVVIAGADHSVLERLFSKPTVEGQNILSVISGVHEIAGMY